MTTIRIGDADHRGDRLVKDGSINLGTIRRSPRDQLDRWTAMSWATAKQNILNTEAEAIAWLLGEI